MNSQVEIKIISAVLMTGMGLNQLSEEQEGKALGYFLIFLSSSSCLECKSQGTIKLNKKMEA